MKLLEKIKKYFYNYNLQMLKNQLEDDEVLLIAKGVKYNKPKPIDWRPTDKSVAIIRKDGTKILELQPIEYIEKNEE